MKGKTMKKYEKFAEGYAEEPNSVDQFTKADKMLMMTAYKEGFKTALFWAAVRGRIAQLAGKAVNVEIMKLEEEED